MKVEEFVKLPKEERWKSIMRLAEAAGMDEDPLFKTTLERYLIQLDILDQLEEAIHEHGPIVSKEYVKGRGNMYSSPAVTEYNRTTDSANKTVSTLLRVIKSNVGSGKSEEDPLASLINGGDDDDDSNQ